MSTTTHRTALHAAALAALFVAQGLVCLPAAAAPDEIRVLSDELTDPGEASLELHAASIRARRATGTRHLGQGLVELSYGVSRTVEVSLQLPVSKEAGWRENGANLEVQYVAPHDARSGPYWGARVELGRARGPSESAMVSAFEVKPIVGYNLGNWHAAVNASLRVPVSGTGRSVTREPALKIARDVGQRTRLGVECYEQAAPHRGDDQDGVGRRRLALVVVDTKVGGIDLNVGAGRGVGPMADGPVLKVIAAFEL